MFSAGRGDYISKEFHNFLSSRGIQNVTTKAYTPQQNGVSERMNRTLLDMVLSMLNIKKMSNEFWSDAVKTSAHIRNKTASSALPKEITLHHISLGELPSVKNLRVFGSKC